jgi:hypothetical protein
MSAPPQHAADARLGSWLASACERESAREAVRELVERFAADAGVDHFLIVLAQGGLGRLAWRWSATEGAQPGAPDSSTAPLVGSEALRAMQAGKPVPFAGDGARDPWLADIHARAGATAPLPGGAGAVGAYLEAAREDDDIRLAARLARYARLLWPLLCRESVESGSAPAMRAPGSPLNWAHEINNALSAIVLHADLALSMQKSRAGDPIAGLLEQICAESIRCANIVRQHAS